jgi:dienelactone hydrolase
MTPRLNSILNVVGLSLVLSTTAIHAAQFEKEMVSYKPVGETRTGIPLPKKVEGLLLTPTNAEKPYPAVVIVHGSGGVDGRGAFYAKALNEAGIATFEIWMFARGKRPRSTGDTWPHVYGALMYLSQRDDFDPKRIGVTGFSWGGANSLETVNKALTDRFTGGKAAFAGHAPLYPVCWAFKKKRWKDLLAGAWTGAPVLFLAGGKDDYNADGGAACRAFNQSLPAEKRDVFEMTIYPDATHKWDDQRRGQPYSFYEKYAYSGKGGRVRIVPSRIVSEQSREAVVSFFSDLFAIQ